MITQDLNELLDNAENINCVFINDIIITIANFLNDYHKILLLSLSKDLHKLKDKICYNDKINLAKIQLLWYYDRFINIRITHLPQKYYKYGLDDDSDDIIDQLIPYEFPISIKRLNFSADF